MQPNAPDRNRRRIFVFLSVAYLLSIALSLAIGLTGGHRSRWIGLGYVSMMIPTISVLIANAVSPGEGRPIVWNRFSLRYLPLALFFMPLIMHAAMLPAAAALGRLHWQGPEALGWGHLTPMELAARIAVNATFGLAAVSTLALFEEIGWRAWLLPRIRAWMSARRAVVVCSIFWAGWHVPYALSGIQYVEGAPAEWTAVVVPIGIFGAGLIIGWIWLRTESVWLAALAHGALNDWGQYVFKFVSGEGQRSDVLVLASGALAFIAAGSILLIRNAATEAPKLDCG